MKEIIAKILTITMTITITCLNISCNDSLIAEIPSYIEITQFNYYENNVLNNENARITDAWVTMDGQNLGAFEIPFRIPILNNETENNLHSFIIYPGIKVNGISATRIKYPYYEQFEINTILEQDSIIHITPSTSYKEQISRHFSQSESQFENGNNILEASLLSDTIPITQDQVVFQGEKSVGIFLDESNDYFHITNSEALNLLNETFLELSFKSSIGFNVGLMIISNIPNVLDQKQELIQLYASDEWKKIYLDLTPLIIGVNKNFQYKIYFEGFYDSNQVVNAVYLDNLNLVSN